MEVFKLKNKMQTEQNRTCYENANTNYSVTSNNQITMSFTTFTHWSLFTKALTFKLHLPPTHYFEDLVLYKTLKVRERIRSCTWPRCPWPPMSAATLFFRGALFQFTEKQLSLQFIFQHRISREGKSSFVSHSCLKYSPIWDSHKKLLCTAEIHTILHVTEWETEFRWTCLAMYFEIGFSSIPAKLPERQTIVLSKSCGLLFYFALKNKTFYWMVLL